MQKLNTKQKARLIISLDFELGWGSIENEFWKRRQEEGVYQRLRQDMADFINYLDDREVTLSWATVGAMVSDRHQLSLSHIPDSLILKYKDFINNSDAQTSDGRDLYEMLLNAKTRQHICSHTYSHVRFSYPDYTNAAITHDLLLSRESLQSSKNTIDALVFPLNHDTTYKPLAESGFKLGRSKPIYKFKNRAGVIGKALDQIVLPPPMAQEVVDEYGIIHHSGSMFFNWPGALSPARKAYVKNAAYRGLKKAVKYGSAFHLWLHPYNLSEVNGLKTELKLFIDEACRIREVGDLEITELSQIS